MLLLYISRHTCAHTHKQHARRCETSVTISVTHSYSRFRTMGLSFCFNHSPTFFENYMPSRHVLSLPELMKSSVHHERVNSDKTGGSHRSLVCLKQATGFRHTLWHQLLTANSSSTLKYNSLYQGVFHPI